MKVLRLLVVVGLVLGAAAAAVVFSQYRRVAAVGQQAAADERAPVKVVVERGSGPRAISNLLADKGVIDDADAFYDYLRFVARKTAALKAGTYMLSPHMTADEIIAALETGRQEEVPFTVREGLRLTEIADIIASSGVAPKSEIVAAMNDKALIKELGVPAKGAGGQDSVPGGMEGYLFPDTYQFPVGTPAADILRRMRARLDEVITDKMEARMQQMGWSLHKVLTLAAIVEKETGQPDERPHIASVFHNRIKKGMKMQTDPTVIYGIEDYDGNIRKKDLLTYHPYNTYVIEGLPPGPIASPGEAAIKAALWPDDTDDLFFVSRNDGTHVFCPTLSCHQAAVQKWQVRYFRNKRRGG